MYPRIDFHFSGWVRDAYITQVTVVATGTKVDCAGLTASEVVAKLRSGEWELDFPEAYGRVEDKTLRIVAKG